MPNTPTDGIGVAAYVTLSGGSEAPSSIRNTSGGFNKTQGAADNPLFTNLQDGQGIGAGTAASGTKPVAQYSLTLSVSAAHSYATTLTVTADAVDVLNDTIGATSGIVVKSYNNPSALSPTWYNPSNFAGYDADVASADNVSGMDFDITAKAPGVAIVECQFPVFSNTLSSPAVGGSYPADTPSDGGTPTVEQYNLNEMIYVQVVVTVIP